MTQLDLDTTTLAAAGSDVGGAAATLAGTRPGTLTASAGLEVTGDAGLSAALEGLGAAWRVTDEALTDALAAVAARLARAADVFDDAERVTADGLAALLDPGSSASARTGRGGA